MGTRIVKYIGYHLNTNKIKDILVYNFKEILEDYDYNQNKEVEAFRERLNNLVNDYNKQSKLKNDLQHILMSYHMNDMPDLSPNQLIVELLNFDTEHGILFLTPELLKKKRFDDLIDYYENVNDINFKSQLLNSAIYPLNGWIYSKEIDDFVPDDFKEEFNKLNLKVGDVVTSDNMHWLMVYYYGKTKDGVDYFMDIKKTTFFHPNIDPLVFLIAKAAGVLKEDVSELMFNTAVEPSIVSVWG